MKGGPKLFTVKCMTNESHLIAFPRNYFINEIVPNIATILTKLRNKMTNLLKKRIQNI